MLLLQVHEKEVQKVYEFTCFQAYFVRLKTTWYELKFVEHSEHTSNKKQWNYSLKVVMNIACLSIFPCLSFLLWLECCIANKVFILHTFEIQLVFQLMVLS